MLAVSGYPILDKARLIGGCSRLPLSVDPDRLVREVEALPSGLWGGRGGRVGVHNPAEAIFLRGHAPAEGEKPVEDRESLARLPYVRGIIHSLIPAMPLRCLLAKLPPGAVISPHVDQADYFHKTLRLHFPIQTTRASKMYCAGRVYYMQPGEVWALNNCTVHAVWNSDAVRARTHLICDFLPSAPLLELLARAERELGADEPDTERFLVERASAGAMAD